MHNIIKETRRGKVCKNFQNLNTYKNIIAVEIILSPIFLLLRQDPVALVKDKEVTLEFKAYLPQGENMLKISGPTAKALLFLSDDRWKGVSCREQWIAPHVHILHSQYGLEIRTDKEHHLGCFHARYALITPVEIIGQKLIKNGGFGDPPNTKQSKGLYNVRYKT